MGRKTLSYDSGPALRRDMERRRQVAADTVALLGLQKADAERRMTMLREEIEKMERLMPPTIMTRPMPGHDGDRSGPLSDRLAVLTRDREVRRLQMKSQILALELRCAEFDQAIAVASRAQEVS